MGINTETTPNSYSINAHLMADKSRNKTSDTKINLDESPFQPVIGQGIPAKEKVTPPSSDTLDTQKQTTASCQKMAHSAIDQAHGATLEELDQDYVCSDETYNTSESFINDLQKGAHKFDTPTFIRGEKGQSSELNTTIAQNREILNNTRDVFKTKAQAMVNNGETKDLNTAYKQLVAIIDKHDELSKKHFKDIGLPPQSTYALRTALLNASQADGAGLQSWSVYTKGGKPVFKSIWPFLENGKNWIPEAQAARAKWIETTVVKTKALSQNQHENTVVLLKGGFGAGKTRLINQMFGDYGSGAIAPDKAKEIDRRANPTLPHSAAHVHGSQAAFELMDDLIPTTEGTLVYDSSLSNPVDVSTYLEKCKKAGKKMAVYDVARNDMARALAVLKRPVDGEDPRIPPDFIVRSAINDKINRVKCMEVILNDTTQDDDIKPEYHFIGGNAQGWDTKEVMLLGSNGKIDLTTPDAAERLALEGIEIDTATKGLKLTLNEDTLASLYHAQFERPVKEIMGKLSPEEQATLDVFSKRRFPLTAKEEIKDATALYLALPKHIRDALPQKAFESAFDSVTAETRQSFFASIASKGAFSYEDLPLKTALIIHQNLNTDPWTSP